MLGMTLTNQINNGLEGARFCKIEFQTNGKDIFGWKNPTSSLLKFGLRVNGNLTPGSRNANDYIYGKAHSMLEEFKGLESMEALFREII